MQNLLVAWKGSPVSVAVCLCYQDLLLEMNANAFRAVFQGDLESICKL